METDIYVMADMTNEQANRYYPQTLADWSRPRLAQFDQEEVGTKAQLEQRRRDYERSLEPQWKEYRDALWTRRGELMDVFKAALATEFLPTLPQSITEKVYDRAWDEGHSSGLRSVVNSYSDVADFVTAIIADYRIECHNRYQEELLKG